MTSQAWRRVGVPLAVALVVLAVVLGVFRLADPPGTAPGGSGVGSPGTGGGGAPGSSGDAVPPSAGGGTGGSEPAPDPDQPMTRFSSVTRAADDRSVEVQFWGGVDDCYRYSVGTEETARTVALTLTEKTRSGGPCIELAQQYDRTVGLDVALGARAVVDATTGDVLLAPSP